MQNTLDELAKLGSLMTRGQLTQPRSVGPRLVGIAEEARATISQLRKALGEIRSETINVRRSQEQRMDRIYEIAYAALNPKSD